MTGLPRRILQGKEKKNKINELQFYLFFFSFFFSFSFSFSFFFTFSPLGSFLFYLVGPIGPGPSSVSLFWRPSFEEIAFKSAPEQKQEPKKIER